MGWCFLGQVILMILLVIWLFVETKRADDREMKQNGVGKKDLQKERRTYAMITTFFGLSYFGRFFINTYDYCGQIEPDFTYVMTYIIVYLLEGASIGVLMLFHFLNFKNGSLF